MDILVIHGSPGCGKTTICKNLHEILKSPWFEFGWIPEFTHLNPHTKILPKKEEQLVFENLILVAKNYIQHCFENILLSDLQDIRMLDIPTIFAQNSYAIITLYSECDATIKRRILERDSGNAYKNFKQAATINGMIKSRKRLPNEYRLRCDNQTVDEITAQVLEIIKSHKSGIAFDVNQYNPAHYFSYFDENGQYI